MAKFKGDPREEMGDQPIVPDTSDPYKGFDARPTYDPNNIDKSKPNAGTPLDVPPESEPEIEPQPEIQPEPHHLVHPFEDVKDYDLHEGFTDKDQKILESVILPAGTHQLVTDFVTEYAKKVGTANISGNLSPTETIIATNVRATDELGIREDTLRDNKGTNTIKHEGVELTGKKVKINVSNQEVAGQLAVSVFNSVVNQSNIFSHNLPSSGFSLSLIDIPEVDVQKLTNMINRATIRKSRETRGNLFSNYGMMVMREVMEFVQGYVYSSSIDVDSYKLADYIRITDMPIVMLLLMEYMHQHGFDVITSCANTLVYDGDTPKCDATITAKVDLRKLMIVDPDKLETWAKKHLSKTSSGAHSVEEVTKYQDTLPSNDNKTYSITSGSSDFSIELRNPTMTESFEAMEQWEDMVRSGVTDITIGKTDEEIANILNVHSLKTVLGMYLHFIVSISDNNGVYVKDRESILDVLVSFNNNRQVVSDIVEAVQDYIGLATVGHVGYVPYVCSKCGHKNGGSELISLDMTSLGFSLVDLATSRLNSSPHIF